MNMAVKRVWIESKKMIFVFTIDAFIYTFVAEVLGMHEPQNMYSVVDVC